MTTPASAPDGAMLLPASRVPDPASAPALRWGVMAPGGIARAFVSSLGDTRQQVVAVGSRSLSRAESFAREHGVKRAYGSYQEVAADPEVDVVYVASPHSEHFAQAMLAVRAGKHVLVEKAFTRNAAEASALIEAARAQQVFLMEAMWTRFLPHIDVLRQVLQAGTLGQLRVLTADHGQSMTPEANQRLFDPALAGGALLDLGVYPVSFASMVLGPFASISAVGERTSSGVDGLVSVVATTQNGAHALLNTTLFAKTPTTAVITGTKAWVELDGDFYSPTTLRLVDAGQVVDTFTADEQQSHSALRYEAAALARCVAAGELESELMPHEETLRVMTVMDEIRRQVGVAFPGE